MMYISKGNKHNPQGISNKIQVASNKGQDKIFKNQG